VELDTDTLLSKAVDLLISQVGSDDQLTRIMVDFVENKAGDELSWQIEKDLNDFGKTLLQESGISSLVELRKYDLATFMKVRTSLLSWKFSWENDIRKITSDIVAMFNRESLTSEAFIQKERGIFAYLNSLANGRFDKIKPNSYATTALQSGEWIGRNSSPGHKAAFDRIEVAILQAGKQLLEMIEHDLPRYFLCRLLLNNLFSTALLSEIEKTLNNLCLENNKLLISEFNRRISSVVKEQPAPFIYERIGERYLHYLIDEFQDTSILQWHNLLPLVENALASNRMNLVVGDAKQAIYRWRSGDARQFEILPQLIHDIPDPVLDQREQTLMRHYRQENLARNHRSSQVIVDLNNKLFTFFSTFLPSPYGDPFKNAIQETGKTDKPGLVRIEKICGDDVEEEKKYDDLVHDKILSIITEITEDNYSYRDLAILCRDNRKASGIATYLIGQGIPVVSSESLLLTQSDHVNFLLAWIKHLVDPFDAIAMLQIIHFMADRKMMPGVAPEDFFKRLESPDPAAFYLLLSKHFSFLDYHYLKSLEIFGLVQFLVHHFDLGNRNNSYLRFFQDVILEFVKLRHGGLPEFLEWWEDKSTKASVIIPDGINAVRIMTIHKAKGLQFPAVIFPFADEHVRVTWKYLWVPVDDQIAEPLKTAYLPANKSLVDTVYADVYEDEHNRSVVDMANVLYVALTRPEERLYVLTKDFPEKNDDPASVPKWFSRFFMSEGLWQKNRLVYQYGDRWKREEPAKPPQEQETPSVPFAGRPSLDMLLRRHAPLAWDMEEPERNREWGTLVHLVMEKVTHTGQVDEVLQNLVVDGLISSTQQVELLSLLKEIIENPAISAFFEPSTEARNEPEILTREGVLFRPDRALIRQNSVTIIDYKTGKPR
jgi:ATP-dependent exoDNAse (exonuclease V) beta subunit